MSVQVRSSRSGHVSSCHLRSEQVGQVSLGQVKLRQVRLVQDKSVRSGLAGQVRSVQVSSFWPYLLRTGHVDQASSA